MSRFSSIVEAVFFYSSNSSYKNKIALVDDNESLSYSDYGKRIKAFAAFFLSVGIKRYDCVLVEAKQCINFLAIGLALQSIGAIFVPIERNCAPEKTKRFIELISPKIVILNRDNVNLESISYSDLEERIHSKVKDDSVLDLCEQIAPIPISEILFTTGTTGEEKGIVLSHSNNVALAENVIEATNMNSYNDNVEFIFAPFNHSHGLRRYYANMYNGSTVVMQGSVANIKSLFEKLDRYKVTAMDMVPSALKVILGLAADKLKSYSSTLKYIQFGGASVDKKDLSALCLLLPNTHLLNMYGSTESGICTCCDYGFNQQHSFNSIGLPTKNSKLLFLDDNGKELDTNRDNPGLLACRSPANMLGYYEKKGTDLKLFTQSVKTVISSDIAYLDDNDEVILIGRKDDVITIGGKKVSPKEIEEIALKYPDVTDCCCVGVKSSLKGQVPFLYITLNSNITQIEQCKSELLTFLRKQLEPYKIPSRIEIIDLIPRTYKGSLKRVELKKLAECSRSN